MKKAKPICSLILCAGLLFSCGQKNNEDSSTAQTTQSPTTKQTEIETETQQNTFTGYFQIMAENKELWLTDEKAVEPYSEYCYAVTDLNQDGKPELIVSVCTGTGIYTYTCIFEADEETSTLTRYEREADEFISEADLIVERATAYYDRENDRYHYIFTDFSKNGAAEHYENIRDWSLQDGKIIENFLAYQSTIYSNAGATVTTVYTDADGEEITEEEYNNMADKKFAGMEKVSVDIQWIKSLENADQMSESEIVDMLSESWNLFHIE